MAPSDASSCSDDFDAYSTHDNLLFRMDQASLRSSKPSLPPCPDSVRCSCRLWHCCLPVCVELLMGC